VRSLLVTHVTKQVNVLVAKAPSRIDEDTATGENTSFGQIAAGVALPETHLSQRCDGVAVTG
tara:strand:- start:54 stop:239 length:186 start_codon:yes stop_codon:yes gene_type:complete